MSDTFTPEEDNRSYTTETSDASSIFTESDGDIASSCTNSDPYTLESYTDEEPGLFIIKVQNSQGKFTKGECLTRRMLIDIVESNAGDAFQYNSENPTENTPQNIMTLWRTPKDKNPAGYRGGPTGKWVFKLPNLMYITLGSLKRVMKNENVREWYAVPLYNNKPRRVGNVYGVIGISMNHGQLPGFRIYKLFTKEEIRNEVEIKETRDDYPLDIAPNGDYEVSAFGNSSALIPAIFHSIATYHIEEIDVYD
jgi:hypothetical protein